MKHASEERRSEKPETRDTRAGDKKRSSDFLTGEVCSIASGEIDAPRFRGLTRDREQCIPRAAAALGWGPIS
jgi:hypothetical protein